MEEPLCAGFELELDVTPTSLPAWAFHMVRDELGEATSAALQYLGAGYWLWSASFAFGGYRSLASRPELARRWIGRIGGRTGNVGSSR